MLRYFRINDPYRLIVLLVLLTAASLPLLISMPAMTIQELKGIVLGETIGDKLMYFEIVDRTGPLMALVEGMLNFLFGRSLLLRHILALLLIFFQAAYFGILLINNKAYNENNYVPALIFGALCFFSFDLLTISPELLGSILLLMALNNIFKEIGFGMDRDSIVLNLGFFLGLASLFVFSYIIFLIGVIFILIVFARATFRKILLLLFGFGLPHAALLLFYYCYERTDYLWMHFYVANATSFGSSLVNMKSIFVLGALPLLYFVFSMFMLTRDARFTKYQSQLFQVIFLWLGIAIIQVCFTPERSPHSFFTFIPSMAYFISHYLLLIRRRFISESMLWILMIGLLSINILAKENKITLVEYSGLFPGGSPYDHSVNGKNVMIVGNDLSILRHNKLSGYFLDWELSKKYFEHPDYYDNVIRVSKALSEDKPDVIIDESGMLLPFVERIPMLKNNYRKDNNIYWKR